MAKILVVDDIQDNVKLLAYDLLDAGFEVLEAYSGAQALEIVREQIPDCILLDIMMPEMDGYEVCRRLKDDPKTQSIPVIMVSAKSADDDIVAGLDLGADDYVTKPFNIRIVEARVRSALRIKMVQDEIREANEKLALANELLDIKNKRLANLYKTAHQFVDNVSHEFRTPLTVIKEFASIVHDGLAGEVNDEQREYLGLVTSRVDDLNCMVNDMLDISKLEAGMLCVRRKSGSVDDIVERTRMTLERKAAASHVKLEYELDSGLPAVYCDPEKISRVVINLAINAIKFVNEGGHVKLWARAEEGASHVVIGVTDNGPGIEKSKLNLIFERFKQVGSDVRASTKGFGLGLNIARELVALNFGEIAVESEPGEGSTFSFTVPVADSSKLVERYVDLAGRMSDELDHLALITVKVDECEAGKSSEIDDFFQNTISGNNLALWTAPEEWLLIIRTNPDKQQTIIEGIEDAWREASRNRPTGPLPNVTFTFENMWPIDEGRDHLIERVQQELQTLEQAHV